MKYKLMMAFFFIMITIGAGTAVSPIDDWVPMILIVGGVCGLIYTLVSAMIDSS